MGNPGSEPRQGTCVSGSLFAVSVRTGVGWEVGIGTGIPRAQRLTENGRRASDRPDERDRAEGTITLLVLLSGTRARARTPVHRCQVAHHSRVSMRRDVDARRLGWTAQDQSYSE